MKKSPRHSKAVIVPAIGIIALVIVIGVLASLVLTGGLASQTQTVTTTQSTTVTSAAGSTATNAVTDVAFTNSTLGSSSSGMTAEQIYANSNRSIVTLDGTQVSTGYFGQQQVSEILGTGFVISYSGAYYVITNYHVAGATSNLTATFSNGDSYPAKVIASDPYSDLAVVTVSGAPSSEFYALSMTSSSSLAVGDTIFAIGNPYGLTGSMTEGIVSQLGRTIQDPTAGNFSIANVIQFSAPINPGNSGGTLLNTGGQVVGVTTATVSSSQGVGFAIPSDTIIKELPTLISTGTYTDHSYLGIEEVDMNYQLAIASGTNTTYGVLIESVVQGGPASNAGLVAGSTTVTVDGAQYLVGGDIIVSVNGTRIINSDALGSYLAEHTAAGQVVTVGIIGPGNKYSTVDVTLGARPPLS